MAGVPGGLLNSGRNAPLPRGMLSPPDERGLLQKLMEDTITGQALKSLYGAATLPGDVYSGEQPVYVVNPETGEVETAPGMIERSADLAGSVTLGAGAVPAGANELRMGIKAYHGSPHSFDKFSSERIGTGEGATPTGGPGLLSGMARPIMSEDSPVAHSLKRRGTWGDQLLNSIDLANELLGKGATISDDGMVTLYHRTTLEGAQQIAKSGMMSGKEDRLFFGTSPTGQIEGYGDAVIETTLPLERLELNDVFSDEAHVTLRSGRIGSKVPVRAKVWVAK